MKNLISLLVLLNVFLLLGCGGGDSSSSGKTAKRYSRAPKKVLSEAEKAKFITATIYYISDYSADNYSQCSETTEVNLRRAKGDIIKLRLCRQAYKGCLMQGSCFVSINGEKTMINYHKKISDTLIQFMLVDRTKCKHGMGDSSDPKQSFNIMCLDPFYSVAADTAIHPLGTVIYIPAVQGTVLPDGSTHDGYFIVRDSGGNIDGRGRFDFFTGHFGLNASNPFSNLGLGGEANFDYQIVSNSDAQAVRARRAFPLLKK